MSFLRILKLPTSPFYQTETCNDSFHLNISFTAVHSSDSFTLSFFFLLVLPWHVTVSDARRPVFSFGRTLTLMCPLYAVQGCHLYHSILSMMLTMLQSLQSFPLHHFLGPKLSFFTKSLSPQCLIRSCQRYVLYICHFLWLLPLKHDSMSYQVQIKFMNFQRRHLVRILQLLSLNVVVIFFQPLRFLPFTFSFSLFLTHFI